MMKPVRLHKGVEKLLESWPMSVKVELADLLALLAAGQPVGMPASRAMPEIAIGAHELRIHDQSGQYRVLYFTKNSEALLVFHAFKKKTRTTPHLEIETARMRLRSIL